MSLLHLSLPTRDLEATRAFYTALFGEAPDKTEPSYIRFAPRNHPIVLSLIPGDPRPPSGHEHYGLRFDDVAETKTAWSRARTAGLEVRTEGEVDCCFARQQKAWVVDPDGRPWELYTVLEDLPEAGSTRCCA